MRAALFWAPALHDPLWQRGSSWLGRDAQTGAACAQPALDGIAELTSAPRHYGFHATLRPPMRLATGWDEFRLAAAAVARAVPPFTLPPLEIAVLGGFLALRESAPCAGLQELAARSIELTDRHRLQPLAEELLKRRAAGLSADQEAMLARWGYPYVMREWFFHMTLTRRLGPEELGAVKGLAEVHFGEALSQPRMVTDLCIFTEATGPFLIAERLSLG